LRPRWREDVNSHSDLRLKQRLHGSPPKHCTGFVSGWSSAAGSSSTHPRLAPATFLAGLSGSAPLARGDLGQRLIGEGKIHGRRLGNHGVGMGLEGRRPRAHGMTAADRVPERGEAVGQRAQAACRSPSASRRAEARRRRRRWVWYSWRWTPTTTGACQWVRRWAGSCTHRDYRSWRRPG
jgi:hypothetical protein